MWYGAVTKKSGFGNNNCSFEERSERYILNMRAYYSVIQTNSNSAMGRSSQNWKIISPLAEIKLAANNTTSNEHLKFTKNYYLPESCL
jgi:hypothetical protein